MLRSTEIAKKRWRMAPVVEDETAAIPEEDLHAVTLAADEDEEVPLVQVEPPLVAHDRTEPVVAAPHVDLVDGQVDPNRRRERQHARSAVTSAAT